MKQSHQQNDAAERQKVVISDPKVPPPGHPHLECNFVSGVNPHIDAGHSSSLAWAVEMGLVTKNSPTYKKLQVAKFSTLVGRTYPDVTYEELCLFSDFMLFFFIYDDRCCDNPEAVERQIMDSILKLEDNLFRVLRSEEDHETLNDDAMDPLERSLADLCRRFKELHKHDWLDRLNGNIKDYISGCRWERVLRLKGVTPNLASYSRLRPLVSGVFVCLDFTAMCIDKLHPSDIDNKLVHQLEIMANNHVSWVNDIHGIRKELQEGSTSNLVIVLANEFDLSLEDALDYAICMCNREYQAFCELESIVVSASNRDSPLNLYIQGMKNWMRGHMDWYSDTARYNA